VKRAAPVVIGVGNGFRHDDGAGPAVLAALQTARDVLPDDVRLAVCDGEPTRMIELWDHAALAIVVDAAAPDPAAGLLAGDVVRWELPREPAGTREPAGAESPLSGDAPAIRSDSAGTHALGPGTAVRLARVLDRLPERLLLLAIVGSDFEPGPGLSEAVAETVAHVAREVATELRREGPAVRSGDRRPAPGVRT
jgi:hydrogenase maturation protease